MNSQFFVARSFDIYLTEWIIGGRGWRTKQLRFFLFRFFFCYWDQIKFFHSFCDWSCWHKSRNPKETIKECYFWDVRSCAKSFVLRCWKNNQAHKTKICMVIRLWTQWIWSRIAWSYTVLFSSIRKTIDLSWWTKDLELCWV
jgi:hypothetical protein